MIFDIVGRSITINPTSLVIPEFKKIWDSDKSINKETAINKLSYVVFLVNPTKKNPYYNYSENDRKNILLKDFNVTETTDVKNAVDKYRLLIISRHKRLITAALDSTDEATTYYKNIKFTDDDFDITEYLNTLEKLNKGVKALRDLEKQLDADEDEEQRVKGGNEIGAYELPR